MNLILEFSLKIDSKAPVCALSPLIRLTVSFYSFVICLIDVQCLSDDENTSLLH